MFRGVCAVGVAALALTLAACDTGTTEPTATPSHTTTSSPVPTPTPTIDPGPVLHPDGTAEDNLPLFQQVVVSVWAGPEPGSGRAYIDALVAAGFDKAAMQVTPDLTTIGNPADTIEFSVRWGDKCLLGQAGPEIGGTASAILPVLADGSCLIGITRPIDW